MRLNRSVFALGWVLTGQGPATSIKKKRIPGRGASHSAKDVGLPYTRRLKCQYVHAEERQDRELEEERKRWRRRPQQSQMQGQHNHKQRRPRLDVPQAVSIL